MNRLVRTVRRNLIDPYVTQSHWADDQGLIESHQGNVIENDLRFPQAGVEQQTTTAPRIEKSEGELLMAKRGSEILKGFRNREQGRFFLQEIDDVFLLSRHGLDLLLQTLDDVL